MRRFLYQRAGDLAEAVGTASQSPGGVPPTLAPVQFLAAARRSST
jgi:hypothetical protein